MLLICTSAYAVNKAQHAALFGSNNQPQDQMHTAPTALSGDLLHQCLKCKVCTMPLLYALLWRPESWTPVGLPRIATL